MLKTRKTCLFSKGHKHNNTDMLNETNKLFVHENQKFIIDSLQNY